VKRFAQGFLVAVAILALAGLAARAAPAGRSDQPVIAGGVIVDANEQGIDGQVLVFAPPASGGAGKLQLVASQPVQGGGFSLTAANTELLTRLAKQNGGFVNLQFVAVGGGFFANRTMARTFTADGGWGDRDGSSNLGEIVLAKGAPGAGPVGKHDRKTAAAGLCTLVRAPVGKPFDRRVVIGQLHSVAGMTASFSYGQKADSDIGTAFSAGKGPFSVSGDAHVGNSTGSSVTITRSGEFGHKLLTQFRFQRWHYASSCTGVFDKIQPFRWDGTGLTVGADVSSLDHHCAASSFRSEFAAGTDFDQESSRSTREGGAVTVAGVQLGADSGYSTSVHLHWHFTAVGVLCGDTDLPGNAGLVFAG
jgi:hypothetical protein